jgi:hypothetical protein
VDEFTARVDELVATGLEALAVLLLAAGAAALLFPALGWGCLCGAGVVVLVGSQIQAITGLFKGRGRRQ